MRDIYNPDMTANDDTKDATKQILKDTRRRNRNSMLICVAILVIITVVPLFNDSTPYSFSATDEFFSMMPPNDLDNGVRIYYDDIISVYVEDTIDFGAPVTGSESKGYVYGTYKNDRWGEYTLCANREIDKVAVFETTKGFVVTNIESGPTTEEFVRSVNESLEELKNAA